jgi:pimeloyl-ACP methyl ester carboxylesterase
MSESEHTAGRVVDAPARRKVLLGGASLAAAGLAAGDAMADETQRPLMIREQGSFAAGGTVTTNPGRFDPYRPTPEGQTLHGDHAYVFYQVPVDARRLPLVFLHGNGQFSKTWETTPDGREGYQNIFLRRRFGVYLIDQPRRGNAGRSTVAMTMTPSVDDQVQFDTFRIGIWPNFFPDVQFPRDAESLNQFFRQITPNTGPFDIDVVSNAVAAVFAKVGPAILVTHSAGGGPGWFTALKNQNVRAIVSYEPGSSFVFPEGEMPPRMPSAYGPLDGVGVPLAEFMRLTRIPIIIFYGDNIPAQPTTSPGQDAWRVRLDMARLWRDAVNRHGGDVTLVHLPEIGIHGNTHFAFSDLNNLEIADLMSRFLADKGLDV